MSFLKNLFSNLGQRKVSLVKRSAFAFLLVMVILAIIIYFSYVSFNHVQKSEEWIEHTYDVIGDFRRILITIDRVESGQRGYLLTNNTSFLKSYNKRIDSTYSILAGLKRHVNDNPLQVKRVDTLKYLLIERFSDLNSMIVLKKSGSLKNVDTTLLDSGAIVMLQIDNVIKRSILDEKSLLKDRVTIGQNSIYQSRGTVFVLSICAFAIFLVSVVVIGWELKAIIDLEKLLNSVLDASNSGILSFKSIRDAKGTIVDFRYIQANTMAHLLTAPSIDSFIGKNIKEVFPTSVNSELVNHLIKVVDTGIPYGADHHYMRKGKDWWVRIEAIKLGDGFTSTLTDITHQKLNELELAKSVDALKRSNRELEEFAYVASHDLQEPLRKIVSFIDRLRAKISVSASTDAGIYMDKIVISASRMKILINDLLAYSRVDKEMFDYQKIDLNAIVLKVLTDLETRVIEKKAMVKVNSLPTIEGVEILIYQLFQNLLGNALKFSDSMREQTITLYSEYLNNEGHVIPVEQVSSKSFCRIYITDTGIGFEEQYSKKIFQLFQRLHGRNEYEGTGLGLAICKKIVLIHHGTIIARGKSGEGAIFIITLPIKQRLTS